MAFSNIKSACLYPDLYCSWHFICCEIDLDHNLERPLCSVICYYVIDLFTAL